MEKFEIEKKQSRIIYLIKDTNIEFYILIPNNNNVSITLNLMENVDSDVVKKMDKRWDESIPRNDCGMFFEGLFTPLLANTFNERNFYRGVFNV